MLRRTLEYFSIKKLPNLREKIIDRNKDKEWDSQLPIISHCGEVQHSTSPAHAADSFWLVSLGLTISSSIQGSPFICLILLLSKVSYMKDKDKKKTAKQHKLNEAETK